MSFHKVREAIAAGIVRFYHISSIANLADILTKALGFRVTYELIRPWLFRVPPHIPDKDVSKPKTD